MERMKDKKKGLVKNKKGRYEKRGERYREMNDKNLEK